MSKISEARPRSGAQTSSIEFSLTTPLAARRVLLGRQSEEGGEFARAGETRRILNGRRHRRGSAMSASRQIRTFTPRAAPR
jgi:hypothetical protein